MSTDEVASDEPNSVTRDQEGVHRCDYCNEIESTEDLLEQHVAQHDNQFKCVICGAILKHKGNLVLHMRIHVSFSSSGTNFSFRIFRSNRFNIYFYR